MRRLVTAIPSAIFFLAVAAFGCFQLIDTDLWLYLRTGEWIVENLRVPRADFISYTAVGRPWVDAHWLAQVVLWLVYAAGGAVGLSLMRLALVIGIFALLYCCCRRWAGPGIVIAVLTLALLVANDRFLMKPDLVALLLAVCAIVILERFGCGSTSPLWALVPLQIIWVNAHPSFFLGPFLILVYAADAWMTPSRRGLRKPLMGVLLVATLSCLVNPYGFSMLRQPWEQLSSPLYREHVIPWKPFPSSFPMLFSSFLFRAMLALCAAALILNLRAFRCAHAVTLAAFGFLAFKSQRHLALFGLLCAPGLSYNLASIGRTLGERWPGAARRSAVAVLAAFSVLLCALVVGVVSGEYYYRQRSMKRFGLGASRIAFPDGAADFLASSDIEGRVFCNYDVGSWFAGRFYPRFTVNIDGRNLVYGEALFREYLGAMEGVEALDREADKYHVSTLFLTHAARDVKALLPSLWKSTRWTPVYADDRAVVFLRTEERGRYSRVDVSDCRLLIDPTCDSFPVAEMRASEFFSLLGFDRCAREMLLRALTRRPALPEAHNHLGVLAMREGDVRAAKAEFLEAARQSRAYAEPHINCAIASLQEGDARIAIREARAAVRLAPSSARARGTLGLAFMRAGELTEAMREVSEAVRLDPGDAEQHSNLGALYQNSGDLDRALVEYETARSLSRDYFAPRFNLALIHAGKGNIDRAIELYQEALSIDSRHAGARRNLAVLYARRGDWEKAREQLAEALRLEPGDRAVKALLREISAQGTNKIPRGTY
jgi:tetratricopeptide (TPR) repeat protein